jgi:hypothetical protein
MVPTSGQRASHAAPRRWMTADRVTVMENLAHG